MEPAREDFARKQAMLSVSLTIYEFALVADHNDDQQYNAAELQDIFHSLSLAFDGCTAGRSRGHIDRPLRPVVPDEKSRRSHGAYEHAL